MATADRTTAGIRLCARVTCPHCWERFSPEDALWISQHPDLATDPRLGEGHQRRFLPSRFTHQGAALDERGFPCFGLACPKCHLPVPRAMFEMDPLFISILGAPSSGKTYFLASMTWNLRQVMPQKFLVAFGDADPVMNQLLIEYEELQFLNPNQDELVVLRKTELQGDLYNTVLFGDRQVQYPRPFIFTLRPSPTHPGRNLERISRTLCLYDNAGEHFLPGLDTANSPVTRHLARSSAILFLFDPTQDLRFRSACKGATEDPQMLARTARLSRERAVRQDTILLEAAKRIRLYRGLSEVARHNRPLIVVVTKYDAWASLLEGPSLEPPWIQGRNTPLHGLDVEYVEQWSRRVRNLLTSMTPELVSAAEDFAEKVLYVPVSAMGRSPETDPVTGALGIRPRDIKPQWTEVPLLYFLACWQTGLIPRKVAAASSSAEASTNGRS